MYDDLFAHLKFWILKIVK